MTSAYYDTIQLIERLHRYFLDVVKTELDRRGIQDINNVQAMILHNVGSDEMTVGELTLRGYYLGSNVSYNVKKMTENGYIAQERSVHDKRSIRVKLTDKGRDLHKFLDDVFKKHEGKLAEQKIENADLVDLNHTMKQLERFWASQTSFSGMMPGDLEDF
ncbi:MAG: MarR family transcriptional regulator [Micavibrio aeruginosavorus]|uniref:MarR family transcriptional regulator n=1 Tax=Micavibrio aeruginosavorus TaxID=349221 RepID=A0A2W5FIF7_9BACT|nr:MAG: MarR family transcriptional regulator [Micavibrio aeruginosavorus]